MNLVLIATLWAESRWWDTRLEVIRLPDIDITWHLICPSLAAVTSTLSPVCGMNLACTWKCTTTKLVPLTVALSLSLSLSLSHTHTHTHTASHNFTQGKATTYTFNGYTAVSTTNSKVHAIDWKLTQYTCICVLLNWPSQYTAWILFSTSST